MVIIQHDFLCGFCDCMGGAESLEKRYIERSEDTLMKTPKLKYRVKRFVAASLCAGMLFTDVGNGILFETEAKSVVFAQESSAEDEAFYLHGSGGNITEGELPFELEVPKAQTRIMARVMSVLNYTTSQTGIDEIKLSEGIVVGSDGLARAYDDMQPSVILQEDTTIKGTITIGYGHTGKINGEKIAWDTKLTLEEAEILLRSDIAEFEKAVNDFCTTYGIILTQYQFDALVCFTYNLGTGWTTRDSSMALMLRNGYEKYTEDEIINIFSLYKYSGNVLMPGLVQRRRKEAAMFLNNASLADYKTGKYKVDITPLSVRSSASLLSPQITTLNKGTEINITKVSGFWGQTNEGWVHLGYCCYLTETDATPVEPTPEQPVEPEQPTKPAEPEQPEEPEQPTEENYPTGFYMVTTPLNVRSGPGTDYDIVNWTAKGDVFYITKTSGKWGKIGKGWISLNPLYSQVYKPQKPEVSTKSNTSQGVKLGWSKNADAQGYYVYRKVLNGSYEKIATITSADSVSYVDTKAENGTLYKYKVFAYRKIDGGICKSPASSVKTIVRLKGVSVSSAKSSASQKLKVTWEKDTNATGYKIQYSTSSSFAAANTKSVTVKSNKTVTKTLSGLISKKKYYVRVRTYKTVDGTTYRSAWSSKISMIVK